MKDLYRTAFAITPSDSGSHPADALYIGGAGNVKVTMAGGGDVTFSGLAAGTLLPVSVTKVFATGTTATLITGLR